MRAKVNYTLNGENESIELEGSKKDIDRGIREIQNIVEFTLKMFESVLFVAVWIFIVILAITIATFIFGIVYALFKELLPNTYNKLRKLILRY
jgi:hypothetical protein